MSYNNSHHSSGNSSSSDDGSSYCLSADSYCSAISTSCVNPTTQPPDESYSGPHWQSSGLVTEGAYGVRLDLPPIHNHGCDTEQNVFLGWVLELPLADGISASDFLPPGISGDGYTVVPPNLPHTVPEYGLSSLYHTAPSPRRVIVPSAPHHLPIPGPAVVCTSPNPSANRHHEALPANHSGYLCGDGYDRPHASQSSRSTLADDTGDYSLPYPPHNTAPPSNASQPSASRSGNVRASTTPCEWDGCHLMLPENTCAGIRRHLRDHHFQGSPPGGRDRVQCQWGDHCGRDPMQWDNIPKHIAGCHTKTMRRFCRPCGRSFARSDALKRHRDTGNCMRGGRQR